MATHVMTPARRAALRKAQLASAAKRRRGGVGSSAKRAVRQKAGYARASASVATRRHVGSKGFKSKAKKAAKYTAIGLGVGAVGAGLYKSAEIRGAAKRTGTTKRHIISSRADTRYRNKYAYKKGKQQSKKALKNKRITKNQYKQIKKLNKKTYSYRRKF